MMEATIHQQLELRPNRVRDHSAHAVNRRIMLAMEASVELCIRQGRDRIVSRLVQLDREWDIDRVLIANFAVLGGASFAVGLQRYTNGGWFERRRTGWLRFFSAQLGFLLLHAVAGWCPPVAVWRRMGVRTKSEIEVERAMLLLALEPSLTAASALETSGPPSAQISS